MMPRFAILVSVLLAANVGTAESVTMLVKKPAADPDGQAARMEMAERGLHYLVSIQKEGALGDSRPKAVTALFLLACLSSGHQLDDPVYGPAMQNAADWLLKNSPQSFLGGSEAPNEDHALAAIACLELAGTGRNAGRNIALYKKARAALEFSLRAQDQSAEAPNGGGWRPDDKTRTNDRLLTAWFLMELHGAQLRDEAVPRSNLERAVEFVGASQRTEAASNQKGGFSVDAEGLAVRSVTGAGAWVLAQYGSESDAGKLKLATEWLKSHPPHWQGPHFYATNFFAVRALYRARSSLHDEAFDGYFARLVRLLRERQDADGSFPFPPGHAQSTLLMGRGYSTALAILVLNVDRGCLPLDGF